MNFPNAIGNQTGTNFANSIVFLPASQHRDDLISEKILTDGLPEFMKSLVDITITDGSNELKYSAAPDYLCIGTNEDYVRFNMMAKTVRMVADKFNAVLPTPKMVKDTWNQSTAKLVPSPEGEPYDNTMSNINRLIDNDIKIKQQMKSFTLGSLVSGCRKDIVNCKSLVNNTTNIAIYGWFTKAGFPIQNLNAVSHNISYQDYSQSARMYSRKMILNGSEVDFYDLLKDSNLCHLISDEGPYDATKIYT